MRKIYPHATYGDTKVFQLLDNLKTPAEQIPFVLFLLPFAWTLITLARRRYRVESGSTAMLAGATVFLEMWVTAGRIEEVRIFLPFAMALIPLTTELAMQRYLRAGSRSIKGSTRFRRLSGDGFGLRRCSLTIHRRGRRWGPCWRP